MNEDLTTRSTYLQPDAITTTELLEDRVQSILM